MGQAHPTRVILMRKPRGGLEENMDPAKDSQKIELSVIIPMYNEAENARATIDAVEDVLKELGCQYEIVPVNDGSQDETLKVLEEIARENRHVQVVSYPANRGRGMALRAGFNEARGEFLVTMDADLSYSPQYIKEMFRLLRNNEADIVVASPYMPGGGLKDVPLKRGVVSRVGNLLLKWIFPGKLHTYTGIFRGYRRVVVQGMLLESNGKEIHLEIIARATGLGYRIKEIPAVLESRKKGSSKFRFGSTVVSHLIFAFLHRPIVLFGAFGGFITLSGVVLGFYVIYLHFHHALSQSRPLFSLIVLLILGGVQILSIGFIAILIGALRRELLKIERELRLLPKDIAHGK